MVKKEVKNQSFYRINIFSIKILGVKVDFLNQRDALSLIEQWVNSVKKYQITTPNPEQVILAQNDYRFKKIINQSSLAIPDGTGLVWALKMKKPSLSAIPHFAGQRERKISRVFKRLSGVDLVISLCKLAAKKNWRVFLLGGKEGVAVQAAEKLTINHPSLTISHYSGSKNIKKETDKERKQTIKRINNFHPDLLFVAYGAPEQEKWIADNLAKLKVKVAMGVGGSFDYLAGKIKRAPLFIRKTGLEWFWRLICQPWRVFRQLRLLKFGYLVIKERFFKLT